MADVRRGLIIVNTGPGKGKTTAAMGTGLRAVGNGMKVLMLQFLKGSWHYGELDAVKAFGDNFIMKQMGRGFVKVGGAETDPEDVRMVEEAWAEAEQAILSGAWDLVILDEINYAISYKMLDPEKVVATLKKKPEMVHVILTGRNAHPSIVEIADTVTEMKEVKHAYTKGIELVRTKPDEARQSMKGYTAIEGPLTSEVPLASYMLYNEFKPSDVAYFQKFFDLFYNKGIFSSRLMVEPMLYKG